MAASPAWEGPPPGSQPTLSGSKTVFLKSIGMFCRTRRPRPNLSAASPCLEIHSPDERRKQRDRREDVREPFLTDQGGTSYEFIRCFECHVCDFGSEREHRLDHRRFLAIEGQEGARRGARRGATAAFCAPRRGSVHGRYERRGCAHQSLQWRACSILTVASDYLPGRPRA